jgi:transposase
MEGEDFTVQTVQKAADLAVQAGSRLYTDSASSYRAVQGYVHAFVKPTQKEYARGDVHENRAECLFSLLKPYLRVFRGVSKVNLPGYVGCFQFLRNFRQRNALEQAELILRAALDPAIARRARQGEFVTCFDHFDLLQTAMCAPLAERREELPGKPRGHMALARHCHAGARPAPQGPRGQPLPPPGAGFSRGCSGETRRASGRRTRTACLAGTSGQRKRRRG